MQFADCVRVLEDFPLIRQPITCSFKVPASSDLVFDLPATAEASTAERAEPVFQIEDLRPYFGCFGLRMGSDFKVSILCSLHFRSQESLHIIKASVAGKSSDVAEPQPIFAGPVAEAALAHRSGVDHDRAVMAVTRFLHPFKQVST